MSWFVGITSAPRSINTLPYTVAQLEQAGWNQSMHLFADKDTPLPTEANLTVRYWTAEKLGAYANFRRMIHKAAEDSGHCRYYLFAQDDVRIWVGLKDYLEREIPQRELAVYFPFITSYDYAISKDNFVGWRDYARRGGSICGAWVMAMSRRMLLELNNNLPEKVRENKHIDGYVCEAVRRLRYPVFLHYPSLIEHLGDPLSTLGYPTDANSRQAKTFVGEHHPPIDNFAAWLKTEKTNG